MRKLAIIAAAVILLTALISAGAGGAKADTPTPNPSATPVTVPVRSRTIILRYMYRGIPVIAPIDHRVSTGDVNGVACGFPVTTDVQGANAITSAVPWPWQSYPPCNAVGLSVRICKIGCTEPFIFDGHDMTVDLNLPDDAYQRVTFGRMHFKRDGAPQQVTLTSLRFTSGGPECFSMSWPQWGGDTPASTISDLAHFFPSVNCSTVGETVDATFQTVEFGELQSSFVWNGGDVDYDVLVTSAATPSPSATASPKLTVAVLPQAGGPPSSGDGFPLATVLGGIAILAGGALVVARRRAT